MSFSRLHLAEFCVKYDLSIIKSPAFSKCISGSGITIAIEENSQNPMEYPFHSMSSKWLQLKVRRIYSIPAEHFLTL